MKHFSFRPVISLFLSMLCVITVSCSPDGGNSQDITDIQVAKTDQYNSIPATTEEFPLPNCGGNRELAQTLGSQASVTKIINVAATATLRGSQEVDVIPEILKRKLEAEISVTYSDTFQNENSRLDSIELKAAPASHVVYVLQWVDEQYVSTVSYLLKGNTYDADYVYTLRVPKISDSYSVECPATNSNQSSAPEAPSQSAPTNSSSGSPVEISAYCAVFGKSPRYVSIGQEVIIQWAWLAKTNAYRQDYLDSVSFSLQLDGSEIDTSSASITLTTDEAGEYKAKWLMPPMTLSEGTHQVVITSTLSRQVLDGFDGDNNGKVDAFGPGTLPSPPCEIIVN